MTDISRLQVQLQVTKLQNKDNPLYQLLHEMIGALKDTSSEVTSLSGTANSNSITNNIINNNYTIQLGSGSSGLNVSSIPVFTPPYIAALFTPGSVLFVGVSGLPDEDPNFFWDNMNDRLGIGTVTPEAKVDSVGAIRALSGGGTLSNGTGIYLMYDAGIGFLISEDSSGVVTRKPMTFVASEFDFAVNGITKASIDVNGNFGIGITNPLFPLHIFSNSTANLLAARRQQNVTGGINWLAEFARDSSGSPAIVNSGDAIGNFIFQGYDGADFQPAVGILAIVDGTPGVGNMPGRLEFQTTPSGSVVRTTRMVIKNNGNVGIGTITPTNGVFEVTGQVYFSADCSALSFTDRTPFYEGDALLEIKRIIGIDGKIDHSTLPEFVRKTTMKDIFEEVDKLDGDGKPILDEKGNLVKEMVKIGEEEEHGRDLGAMISMLTVAVQQLTTRTDELMVR